MSRLHVSKFAENTHDSILVLLHGWGSSSKIWKSSIQALSEKFEVWCIDLPGHGENKSLDWDASVEQGMQLLSEVLPPVCSMVGWSLGGLYAQFFLQYYPKRVKNLMLIASTPKFVASEDWLNGMPKEKFKLFCNNFAKAPQETLQQFFALQALHGKDAKKIMQILSQAAVTQEFQKITWGLQWLGEADLRNMKIPKQNSVYCLQGDADQLVSMQSAKDTLKIWPKMQLYEIAKAAHLPFVSHPEIFIKHLQECFLCKV